MSLPAYEKLATFYLGKVRDVDRGETTDELLLYDAKDLTTHAVCVGMTGSGKTGLCISLLEEAALDGVPAIAIDPKGDLGNLLLAFPELRASDFRPWIEPEEASREGMSLDEYAGKVAASWQEGLARWQEDGERIGRYRDAVDLAIYTPGSSAGLPLRVLKSLGAPPQALQSDADAMRERVMTAVSGLLALLGIEADPIQSREHILLSSLLDHAWRRGRDLALTDLIREIQQPPFDRIGVIDLEAVYPAKDRFSLAMTLNNVLASPGFQVWREGEPLDVAHLLTTEEGKPRLSIVSIAHLSDSERMFFVTMLLNEVVAWMRAQPGSSSLKAILYMDEVFGFLPPTANPPSKLPMLTLLKQARAFGLGVVLATQNPVDLDYKALSNAGTWFLGRLQTERDKARVLDGLEGASATAGRAFDRRRVETILSGLESRSFLLNNVHEDAPVVFQTRWALSYLRGPLTRAQIHALMAPRKAAAQPPSAAPAAEAPPRRAEAERPVLPPEVPEAFVVRAGALREEDELLYRPVLLAEVRVHYARTSWDVDHSEALALLAPLEEEEVPADVWADAHAHRGGAPETQERPEREGRYAPLPAEARRKKSYDRWRQTLVSHVVREHPLRLWRSAELKEVSRPGEREGDFRARLAQRDRERRDTELGRLREAFAERADKLQERIRKAEQRLEVEQEQYASAKTGAMVSLGQTILGALLGRKKLSRGNVGRAGTTARGASRAWDQKQDVERAAEDLEVLRREMLEAEAQMLDEVARLEARVDPTRFELEGVEVRAKKSAIEVRRLTLAWTPWAVDAGGRLSPRYE